MNLKPYERVKIEFDGNTLIHGKIGTVLGISSFIPPNDNMYIVQIDNFEYMGGFDTIVLPPSHLRRLDYING